MPKDNDLKFLKEISDHELGRIFGAASRERARRRKIKKVEAVNSSECDAENISNIKAFVINSSSPLSIRSEGNALCHRAQYYKALICQDWSCTYPRSSSFGDYYVYAHVDPRKPKFEPGKNFGGALPGTPFYIGKGIGSRAYDLKRNEGHGKILRQLLALDYKPEHIVKIMFDGLSEQKAYELEAKLIYFFGTIFNKTKKHGCLVNLEVPKTPVFVGEMVRVKGQVKDVELAQHGFIDI